MLSGDRSCRRSSASSSGVGETGVAAGSPAGAANGDGDSDDPAPGADRSPPRCLSARAERRPGWRHSDSMSVSGMGQRSLTSASTASPETSSRPIRPDWPRPPGPGIRPGGRRARGGTQFAGRCELGQRAGRRSQVRRPRKPAPTDMATPASPNMARRTRRLRRSCGIRAILMK